MTMMLAAETARTSQVPAVWRDVPAIFALIALPLALALMAMTPPFQVADEPFHFFRAYTLSEGDFLPARIGGVGGGHLPSSILEISRITDPLLGHPERAADWGAVRGAFARPLEPDSRVDAGFPGSAAYFPLVYLPQAAGIAVGRLLGFGPLALLYWGRLFNALASIALLYFALRVTPVLRRSLALVALLPMVSFLRASVAADSVTLGFATLFVAVILRFALEPGPRLSWKSIAGLAAAGLAVALTKQTYGILGLMLFMIPGERLGGRLRGFIICSGILMVMAIATGSWSAYASTLFVARSIPGVSVSDQLHFFRTEPIRALSVLIRHLWTQRVDHLWNGFGGLGWLDAHIPKWTVWTLLMTLSGAAVFEAAPLPISVRHKVLALATAAAGALAIVGVLYLVWTPARSMIVEGVQGRYFLPLIPLLLVVAYTPRLGRLKAAPMIQSCASVVFVFTAVGATIWTVAQRYWIPG